MATSFQETHATSKCNFLMSKNIPKSNVHREQKRYLRTSLDPIPKLALSKILTKSCIIQPSKVCRKHFTAFISDKKPVSYCLCLLFSVRQLNARGIDIILPKGFLANQIETFQVWKLYKQ